MNRRNIGVLAASTAFATTLALYIMVERFLLADMLEQYPIATTVSAFIGAVGIYSVLFVLLFKAISHMTVRLTLGGRWYHVGRIEGVYGNIRQGYVTYLSTTVNASSRERTYAQVTADQAAYGIRRPSLEVIVGFM